MICIGPDQNPGPVSEVSVSYRPCQAIRLSTVWLRHWRSSNGVPIADPMTAVGLGSSVKLPQFPNVDKWECVGGAVSG